MKYYAFIDTSKNNICYDVCESEEVMSGENLIEIPSLDKTLILRKKYIDGQWVDTTADEASNYDARYGNIFGHWLDDAIGDIDDLSTADKTSLVAAVNECFQSASDGKTAIANAITGVDDSITIPENPTFAQLADLIGQISTGK